MSLIPVTTMKDCFGIEYQVVSMPGNGTCGYSCLAYALTGDERQYVEVVEDFFKAFAANPQLFVQQTEFGKRNPNLSVYEKQMRLAIAGVDTQSLKSIFWCEDSHLIAFALLFDVTVFVYDSVNRKWYAYGDSARKGYICLLSSGGHFDVLEGPHGKPRVPRQAEKQCFSLLWHQVNTVDVDRYPYMCVNKWDDGEVELIGSDSSSSALHQLSYAEIVRGSSPVSIDRPLVTAANQLSSFQDGVTQETMNSQQVPLIPKTACSFQCNVCSRTFVSKRGLNTHCSKIHRKRVVFKDVSDEGARDTENADSVASKKSVGTFSCDACTESFPKMQALRLHQTCKHKVTSDTDLNVTNHDVRNTENFDSRQTILQCSKCSRTFASKRSLRVHVSKMHKELDDAAFQDMITEVMQDTGDTESIASEKSVASNIAADTCVCAACGKSFQTKRTLLLHQFRKHQIRSVADVAKLEVGNTENSARCSSVMCCYACNKSFNNLHALKCHQRNKHGAVDGIKKRTTANNKQTSQKPVETKAVKGQSKIKPTTTTSHRSDCHDIPSNSYSCSFCNKSFKTYKGLKTHIGQMHKEHSASAVQSNAEFSRETKGNTTRTHKNTNKQSNSRARGDITSVSRDVNQRNASLNITDLYKNYPPLKQSEVVEDNEMHLKLKTYHDKLLDKLNNISTQKVTDEICEVVDDVAQIENDKRKFTWTKEDEK